MLCQTFSKVGARLNEPRTNELVEGESFLAVEILELD